jgi:hypothetical protein
MTPPTAAPDPLTGPLADPLGAPLADPVGSPTQPVAGPNWPCTACGTVNPIARDTCSACGLHFLAAVRAGDAPLLELPLVGDITRLSRGQRFALAGAVALAVIVLTLLIGLILG